MAWTSEGRLVGRKKKIRLIVWVIWQGQRGFVLKGGPPAWNNSFCQLSLEAGRVFKAKLGPRLQFSWGKSPKLFLSGIQCYRFNLRPQMPRQKCPCGVNIISRSQWLAAKLVISCCHDSESITPPMTSEVAGGNRTLRRPSIKLFNVVCNSAEPAVLSVKQNLQVYLYGGVLES